MSNIFLKHRHKLNRLVADTHISYLAVFGSQARGDASPDSDIDLLVEYNQPVGLFHHVATQMKLEKLFNKKVDLVTTKGLSKIIKPYIVDDLKVLYEKGTESLS